MQMREPNWLFQNEWIISDTLAFLTVQMYMSKRDFAKIEELLVDLF